MFTTFVFLNCFFFGGLKAMELVPMESKIVPSFNNPRLVGERIIDGDEVRPPHSFNFQVALFIELVHTNEIGFCAGSLVSRRYVLTAGHCVAGATNVTIIFGVHNINKPESSQIRMYSNKLTFHPDFVIFFSLFDVAIIELPEAVPLSDEIGLVKLPSLSEYYKDFDGQPATLLGWGYTSENSGQLSDVLRQTDTKIIGNELCLESYFIVQPSHICMDCTTHRCPCNGDSGGAVIHNDTLIGIMTFGSTMGCSDHHPAGGSRITSFLEWIAENTDVKLN